MKRIKTLNIIIALLLTFTLISCDSNRVYEEYKEIDDYLWHNENKLKFEFDIQDTTSLHNIFINVRHANVYPYSNLWLFINSSAPNGLQNIDTVECVLAGPKGNWAGDGLGDIWDIQLPWQYNTRFPIAGKYTVEFEQAMRTDILPGIMDIGLRVEKSEIK